MKTKPFSDSGSGKGDTPRNLGPKFRENFDAIDWGRNCNKKRVIFVTDKKKPLFEGRYGAATYIPP